LNDFKILTASARETGPGVLIFSRRARKRFECWGKSSLLSPVRAAAVSFSFSGRRRAVALQSTGFDFHR